MNSNELDNSGHFERENIWGSCEQWNEWISFLADSVTDKPASSDQHSPANWSRSLSELETSFQSFLQDSDHATLRSASDFWAHFQVCSDCQETFQTYLQINQSVRKSRSETGNGSIGQEINLESILNEVSGDIVSPATEQKAQDILASVFSGNQQEDTRETITAKAKSIPLKNTDSKVTVSPNNTRSQKVPGNTSSLRRSLVWGLSTVASISAVLLVWFNLPGNTTPAKKPVASDSPETAYLVSNQFKEMHEINRDQWLDQQLMIQSMVLELQALRVKIDSTEAEPNSKKKILSDIDRLLNSLRNVRTPDLAPTDQVQANPAVLKLPPGQ